jgi:hypothetical protein
MAALKSAAPAAPATAIRRIQPLRPTATAAALQQTPKEEAQFGGSAANDAEQRLAQRIDDLCRRTPPKPQRVSIGVQSPNFMMEQQQQADKGGNIINYHGIIINKKIYKMPNCL